MLQDIGHALSFEILFQNEDFKVITAHSSFHAKQWLPFIQENDIVIFSDAFYSEQGQGQLDIYKNSAPNIDNLYFFSNDLDMHKQRAAAGFPNCFTINQNAFIDPNLFYIEESKKEFDFIYNARPRTFKRHYLAELAANKYELALILGQHAGHLADVNPKELLRHTFVNEGHLSTDKVRGLLNQSRVGIILSDVEGACFSSSEYLLCGLPVISTRSKGGRDVWYNDLNSIIVDDSKESVLAAMDTLMSKPIESKAIREDIVSQIENERARFLASVMAPIFDKMKVRMDPTEWFDGVDYRAKMVFQRADSWKRLPDIYNILTA